MAASAAIVRCERADRASPVHGVWAALGVFEVFHREILDQLGAAGELDWSAAIRDAAGVRAKKGVTDRLQSVDRGKKRSKMHNLSDANGTRLIKDVSAANTHDSVMLRPMVERIPRVRSRHLPVSRADGR
jgi:hypothetical protein